MTQVLGINPLSQQLLTEDINAQGDCSSIFLIFNFNDTSVKQRQLKDEYVFHSIFLGGSNEY